MTYDALRHIACDCAEQALPDFEREFPDDKRVRQLIEVTRRFADGEATKEELAAARRATDRIIWSYPVNWAAFSAVCTASLAARPGIPWVSTQDGLPETELRIA